jgi:predicted alpha/beta superfamily hydrolase
MTKLDSLSRRNILIGAAAVGISAPALAAPTPTVRDNDGKRAGIDRSEEKIIRRSDGQDYRIQIGFPHKVEEDLPLMIRGRKPVPIYVLDGGDNFATVVGLTRMMQYGGSVPPCLIIGISYLDAEAAEKGERRSYDLTPSKSGGLNAKTRYGGSELFRTFLEKEVMPLVESSYDVDNSQSTLVGHSFGGLFALETALRRPELFPNILSLSPSLWFDKNRVILELQRAIASNARFPRVVALTGDREQDITGADFNMTRNVELLAEYAAAAGRENIFARVLEDTTHHSIQGQGFTYGLRKLLDPTPPSAGAGCVIPHGKA